MPLNQTQQFSPADLEHMRQILAQHAGQMKPPKEFDLAKPDVPPYRFQEFPKIVYHHGKRVHKVAQDADHQEALEAEGFQTAPYPAEVESLEPELSAAELAEVAALDKEARKPKKKAA